MTLAQSQEEDIREYAAFTWLILPRMLNIATASGRKADCYSLINLAHSRDVNAQCLAIAALRRMCQLTVQNRGRMIEVVLWHPCYRRLLRRT